MSFDFDDDIIEDEAVNSVVQSLASPNNLDESNEELSEVEERLELASHYRLLLNDRLFNSESPASYVVEKEIRDFIKERLSVLVGLKPEKTTLNEAFTQDEITALKAVAARVTTKPQIIERKPVVEPTLNKVESASQPTTSVVKPAPSIVPPSTPPKLSTPTEAHSSKVSSKPVAVNKKKVSRKQKIEEILASNEVGFNFTLGNKKYTIIQGHDFQTGEPKKIASDITPAVQNPSALPMPMGNQMTMAMNNMAMNQAAKIQGGAGPLSQIVNTLLTSDTSNNRSSEPSNSNPANNRP